MATHTSNATAETKNAVRVEGKTALVYKAAIAPKPEQA